MPHKNNVKAVVLASNKKNELLANAQTLMISTSSEDGSDIEWGVAPFVRLNGMFYIYVSELGAHVRAILKGHSVLFSIIEDESVAQNIWARIRLKFQGKLTKIERGNEQFIKVCKNFSEVHGPVMSLIKDFSDFHLIEIEPVKGTVVTGFGSAFNLSGINLELTERLSSNG